MVAESKTCVITGANGFVGAALKTSLQRRGWRVIAWTRQPRAGTDEVAFRLGQIVDAGSLGKARALVHCAYDFNVRNRDEIMATNVTGSEKLFQACRKAGVESLVFISTLSAFEGCGSLYGQAKLQIEKLAEAAGACVIRPGLVYGDNPGGVFGRLVRQVSSSRVVPQLSGGSQVQYLLHEEDLGNLVGECAEGRVSASVGPISIAHDQGWELKDILAKIGLAMGKRVTFVPVPWRLVWLGLKTLELAGFRPKFRSDSLLGMVYQNPSPSFALAKALGIKCRPFQFTPAMLAGFSQTNVPVE